MTALLLGCFIIGYLLIVFEHPLKLDKTIPALLVGGLCWTIIALGKYSLADIHNNLISTDEALLHHLGKIAEILIFLIGAMAIVEVIDAHKGFVLITNRITAKNKIALLWIISWLSFIMSAALDNLTTTIIFISLLKKLIDNRDLRIWYVSFVIIAANAGGAWSPIGDVTTTMLWTGGKLTSQSMIVYLIIPSILCLLLPLLIASLLPVFKGSIKNESDLSGMYQDEKIDSSNIVFIVGILGLLFVPIFKSLTHLPPWMGIIISLSVLWLVTEYIKPTDNIEDQTNPKYKVKYALSRIEMPSILFFLGILMAINALESTGILRSMATKVDSMIPNRDIVATAIGVLSAIIDNVPLVAATMGMYTDVIDSKMWHFIAFSAGTGGSMLIIGSAAGVAAMGLERIDFIWYLKKISWLAAIGFLAGCLAVSLLMV